MGVRFTAFQINDVYFGVRYTTKALSRASREEMYIKFHLLKKERKIPLSKKTFGNPRFLDRAKSNPPRSMSRVSQEARGGKVAGQEAEGMELSRRGAEPRTKSRERSGRRTGE